MTDQMTATPVRPVGRYQLDATAGRLTPAERVARGKAARAEVPRDSHAVFDPPKDRPDPIALLEEQAQTRVPELVPIRWGRMMVSPFTYYRGAALPMASDLATTPVSGLAVQACGDAHLSNFGLFGSAERRLVFDVNDFDETLPGPWEWDVKRLAASLEVAARENGFPTKQRREIVLAAVSRYRQAMRAVRRHDEPGRLVRARRRHRAPGPVRFPAPGAAAQGPGQGPGQGADQGQHAGAGQADPDGRRPAADHLRSAAPGPRRGAASRPRPHRADLEGELADLVGKYQRTLETDRRYLLQQFEFCDMARKVVGVGQRRNALLDRPDARPRRVRSAVLAGQGGRGVGSQPVRRRQQVRQPGPAGGGGPAADAGGERHLPGLAADRGGLDGRSRDFYVRQLRDWKFSVEIEFLRPEGLQLYAALCGWTLARAHARSGDRIAIARLPGRLGRLRPGHREVRRGLRRSERARPPGAASTR